MAKVAKSAAAYLALGAFSFLSFSSALADDACNKPLQMLGSLPMKQSDEAGLVTIPVSLNGVEKQFLFDTGGYFSQIAPEVADELKLKRREGYFELYASDGSKTTSLVTVPSIAIGPLRGQNYDLPVSPNKGVDGKGIDGIFAPVGFRNVDFEINFAAGKLNIFLNDHCDGRVIYWPAKAVAVVPVVVREDNHLSVPVTVDGHKMTAIIDTGASASNMRFDMAKYVFGLQPDSPDMNVIGHLGGDEKAPVYEHHFQTLSFEGITVTHPRINILTDVVNKNADHGLQTGSHIKTVSDDLTLPEMIVGMDVLRKLHLYLAFKERRLYLTEASAPASSPAPATAPAATAAPQ